MYEWDPDYSDECESCWRAYNRVPREEPCYSHRGKKNLRRPLDDKIKGDYVWRPDDPPYDFTGEERVLNRLYFHYWRTMREDFEH